ncbi:MAG TPA: alpha-E domain-containing protein [Candidatus Corynebacterium avicola]|uniref:Alpha-E domain-containing protein n=1 Tax=Candidatus Corynebacterium avicola TaxID=2838527 RepID=A0A9D1RKZ0_9CORY|nr:alpha-E domain-containing protein [Candidatus Corynebacterium avicola]
MLSRIAESLFWIGRYIERADDQARVLTMYAEHTTDADSSTFSADLCHAMGAPAEDGQGSDEAWSRLGTDPDSPQSMVNALNNCRDSARRAREILATPTWEAINRSYRMAASGRLSLMRPALACREVHDSCSSIIGTLHATMPRDQAWHFLNAGRYIERMDMTARIIHATVVAPALPAHRHLLLQACGAQQSFVMTRGREDNLTAAVDFLLRDRLCPRSVIFCLDNVRTCLSDLDPTPLRSGFEDDSQRLLGQLSARIEYMRPNESLENLGQLTHLIQETGAAATQALSGRYFEGALSPLWHER